MPGVVEVGSTNKQGRSGSSTRRERGTREVACRPPLGCRSDDERLASRVPPSPVVLTFRPSWAALMAAT
jgi:hypothetical protein